MDNPKIIMPIHVQCEKCKKPLEVVHSGYMTQPRVHICTYLWSHAIVPKISMTVNTKDLGGLMEEPLAEVLRKIANHLRFFGMYAMSDSLFTLSVWCEQNNISAVEDLPWVSMNRDETLREQLADLAHRQWSGWVEWMLARLTPENIERWRRQIETPYAELSEQEKDSDRAEADKVLDMFGIREAADKARKYDAIMISLREIEKKYGIPVVIK